MMMRSTQIGTEARIRVPEGDTGAPVDVRWRTHPVTQEVTLTVVKDRTYRCIGYSNDSNLLLPLKETK